MNSKQKKIKEKKKIIWHSCSPSPTAPSNTNIWKPSPAWWQSRQGREGCKKPDNTPAARLVCQIVEHFVCTSAVLQCIEEQISLVCWKRGLSPVSLPRALQSQSTSRKKYCVLGEVEHEATELARAPIKRWLTDWCDGCNWLWNMSVRDSIDKSSD